MRLYRSVLSGRNSVLLEVEVVERVAEDRAHVAEGFARLECGGDFFAGGLDGLFVEAFFEGLDAEANATLVLVDLDHDSLDLVAEIEFVFDLFDVVAGDLGDVNETVDLVGELDEGAERGDLRDFALHTLFFENVGRMVKNATSAKIIQLVASMKVVGFISINAAEAIRPMTVNRNIRSVCSK